MSRAQQLAAAHASTQYSKDTVFPGVEVSGLKVADPKIKNDLAQYPLQGILLQSTCNAG